MEVEISKALVFVALGFLAGWVRGCGVTRRALTRAHRSKKAVDDSYSAYKQSLTTKEAWWSGYRAGKGVPPDTPRQEALNAALQQTEEQ